MNNFISKKSLRSSRHTNTNNTFTYLDDMDELEDVLYEVEPDEEESSESEVSVEPLFETEKEETDFVNSMIQLMVDFVNENPTLISEPDFHEDMLETLKEVFLIPFDSFFFDKNRADYEEEIDELLKSATELFYMSFYTPRSYPDTRVISKPNIVQISKKIKELRDKPLPPQRTKEWYEYRHNLLTASNAFKVFESDSQRNQLIYEKCQPVYVPNSNAESDENVKPVNVNSPLHWGQKYEPLSDMIYEDMFQTKIGEFGCIPHSVYSFLGASPDGINIDPTNSRYGRMLEIKNIVNREIDGIPKKEYWIQMQLQMETCDLDECDFLETKFVEYENETEFLNDGTFLLSSMGDRKGIIMYFSTSQGKPIYEYKPLNMDEKETEKWMEDTMTKYETDSKVTWIKYIYWKLEDISCVLVPRNKKWFEDNVDTFAEIWKVIEKERVSGFEHRAPKKRVASTGRSYVSAGSPPKDSLLENKCYVQIVKIRTDSMDETKQKLDM